MEVRRSTVGVYEDSLACQLLGQTYYVHPDKTIKITVDLVVTSEVIGAFPRPRRPSFHALARSFPLAGTAPGRAEVHVKELGFHFVDPLAPIAEKEIVPRVRVFIPYLGIEGWISITSRGPALNDGHLIVELKYLQAMHVKNRMLKKCCYTLYLLELADRLRGEASRETLKTARKNVVEFDMVVLARPTLMRVIRKFANAIARKAAEARGETFVPTPYDETAVDAVVVTAVPPVAPVVSAPAGPPLKALEAMGKKELGAELDAAGVPSKGRAVKHTAIEVLRNLVRRLRAGEPAASLKATLVADGAKKVVFQYGRPGNGTDYLVARWRGLAETDPLRLEFDELARRDVAAAAADELPVDRLQRAPDPGLVNLPTIWPRMRFPSALRLRGAGRRRLFPAFRYAQPECGVRYPYGSKLGLFKGRVGGGVRGFVRFASVSSSAAPARLDADSTPTANLPRALVLRLLRLGPVRRAAEEFPNLLKALATVPRSEAASSISSIWSDATSRVGLLYLTAVLRPAPGGPRRASLDRDAARMCYRVIRDAKRRMSNVPPRAEDDQCPAYYGVDYIVEKGKAVCKFTVHEGTKTLKMKSAPADRRRSREALRSLETAFAEFMPERFYGIDDRSRFHGKVAAVAHVPGSGNGASGLIVFGTYDSKVEVAPPRLERYKADFALQLKDLAYAEAADEAYLRDQAAALAPPEPMPDGSRPPIDAHSRRVALASRTRSSA
ncbi:hypothetical protein JL720_4183 [Aureococcus anophagefferens]|nr:hypothetical protein JL720_4183 [Aureococcus anophagefferens]